VGVETCNVLFLCTGNSARSILAEAILNGEGGYRFRAFSAGSHPKGQVHPAALSLLQELGHPTENLRSKSWDEFAGPDAPRLDMVITVCDNAAGEVCPIWPGKPVKAHWSLPDPAAIDGPGQANAFRETYDALQSRIAELIAAESANG
jgi:protein-tyrosine-phosphatase